MVMQRKLLISEIRSIILSGIYASFAGACRFGSGKPKLAKMLHKTAGDSGDFGDAEQHTSKLCCIPCSQEREGERSVIWRPQRWIN